MKALIALLVLLISLPAAAQEIRYKMDELAKGFTITTKNRNGGLTTYQMMGLIGSHYYYRSYRGSDVTAERGPIIATDVDGNIVRVNYRDGNWITFEPHSCYRVLGDCIYVENSKNREPARFTRTTALDGTQIRFSILKDGASEPFVKGHALIDRMGWPVDVTYYRADGKVETEMMLSRDYK